ncbi:hypothetical protein LX32DRAFT_620314 [Colletotrichum zoysiae]|uniref:Uncharacterized protein n=1 Tax=Colletotrichum zoysiae TaxID=1216348 RepID=A0AAD9LYZ4_9PEZI|nr:hypothetical protein LX32DRAFT_620314 [Colletotrichum zoysiae]
MQLLRLTLLVLELLLLTGAEGSTMMRHGPRNAWANHRGRMEWWMLWPKNDDRGLKLKTLPACIRDCITPENSWIMIRDKNMSVHDVKRREFCDPRLMLVKKYFVRQIGTCTLESCRYEHSLWRLREHYNYWLQTLCKPPGVRRPKNIWRLKFGEPKMKPMIDPAANMTEASIDAMDGGVDWDADDENRRAAYEYHDWDADEDSDWGAYEDSSQEGGFVAGGIIDANYNPEDYPEWDYDELDWSYEDVDREARTTDEAVTINATHPRSL